VSLAARAVRNRRETRNWAGGDPGWGGYPGDNWWGINPWLFDPNRIPNNGALGFTTAGVNVLQSTALRVAIVYACVSLLADTVSQLPIDVYQRMRNGEKRLVQNTPQIIDQPGMWLTQMEWVQQQMVALLLRGNAFNLVSARDEDGYPTQLISINPDLVSVRRRPGDGRTIYTVNGELVDDYDMQHIRAFMIPGWPLGLSPVDSFSQTIGLGIASERFASRYFADNATPSSVLETAADITDETAREIQKRWIQSHGGARYPAVLGGGLQFKPISITPEESQFLQTQSFNNLQIARIFRIPPHMIGEVDRTTSWGKGIEEQSRMFYQLSLVPWLKRLEDKMTSWLPPNMYVRFNPEGLLRADTSERYAAYLQARQGGWLNVDEIREKEDLPPIEDGSGAVYLQPLNYGPLGSVTAPETPFPPQAPQPAPSNVPASGLPGQKKPASGNAADAEDSDDA